MHFFSRALARLAAFLLIATLIASGSAQAAEEKRVALVIGNAAYQDAPPLLNPRNDAEDMMAALKGLGFQVVDGIDLDRRGMDRAMARFSRLAQDADAALVYYAGHGLQYLGQNFLVPVDAKLEDEHTLQFEMTRLDDILGTLDRARGVKILVLDACRNNPFAERLTRMLSLRSRDFGGTRGLAKIERTQGMIIAYATQSNQVAADGGGRNSPFTAALLKELPQPDVEIGVLFRRVAVAVNKATEGRQTPELSLSLMGEFYFKRAGKLAADKDEEAGIVSEQDRERRLRERLARLEDEKKRAAEELAAMEKVNREKARREAAEREALLKAQAEKERLAREQQVERDRIAKLEGERKRLAEELAAREKAEQERLVRDKAALDAEVARLEAERKATQERLAALEAARKEGATKADTAKADAAKADDARADDKPVQQAALPAADDAPKAKSLADPAPSGPVLVRAIQGELKRLGCYAGAVDQRWGSPGMKRALAGFSRHASLPPPKEPDAEFLERLKGQHARVCPLVCGPREVARGSVCVAKVCPAGSRLDGDGECVRRKEEKSRATANVPTDTRVGPPLKPPEARQAPAIASRSAKIEELRQRARARCSARINPLRDPEGRTCEQLQSELFALERQR